MLWPPWGRGFRNIRGVVLLLACHWLEEKEKKCPIGEECCMFLEVAENLCKEEEPFSPHGLFFAVIVSIIPF